MDNAPWEKDTPLDGGASPALAQPSAAPSAASGPWDNDKSLDTPAQPNSLIDDSAHEVGLKAQTVTGFASNPEEEARYYAKQLYPNEPIDQSIKRFGLTQNGTLYHVGDDGKAYNVLPTGGLSYYAGKVLHGAGKAIPVATGAAAGIVTAPAAATGVGLAATMGAAAGGAAGGEYARQKIGDYLLGDAETPNTNWLDVAKEGAMSGLGQGIGVGIGKYIERNQVRDISRLDPQKTAQAYNDAKAQGIELTPGQATGLKSVQAEEKRLFTRVPETVDMGDDFLRSQNKAVEGAWGKVLDKIAQGSDAEDVGRAARDVASGIVTGARNARSAVASPWYQRAFAESQPVDLTDTLAAVDDGLKTAARSGSTQKALQKVQTLLTQATDSASASPEPNLEVLHNARMEIGQMIQDKMVDRIPINNVVVRKLSGVMDKLTSAMDDASTIAEPDVAKGTPTTSLYKTARQLFDVNSDRVDDVVGSAVQKIADLNDPNLAKAAREALNPATRTPASVARVRAYFEGNAPDVWQGLKRQWLDESVTKALKESQSGEVVNPAGKILQALEDRGISQNMKAALSADELSNIESLKTTLRKIAGANLRMGSDTAANTAADRAALESAKPVWAKAISAVGKVMNPLSWHDIIAPKATQANMVKAAQGMAKLATSGDPNAIEAMKALRSLSANEWRVLGLSGQLGGRGVVAGAGALASKISAPQNATTPEQQPYQ